MYWLIGLVFVTGLLLLATIWYRNRRPRLRPVPAWSALERFLASSQRTGTRLHVGLGSPESMPHGALSSLAGIAVLRRIVSRAAPAGTQPIASSGEAAASILAHTALRAGYSDANRAAAYQPQNSRLAGLGSFAYAAGVHAIISDDDVASNLLIGRFGPEVALLAESAERADAGLAGASDDLAGQAVLFAASQDPLIGEELFAGGAYLGAGPWHIASLVVQDLLRWLIILFLVAGAAARVIGIP